MICRLYEFKETTGIDVECQIDCNNKCKNFLIDENDIDCKLCSDKEKPLVRRQKYGWTRVRLIDFSKSVEVIEDEETAFQIMKLIHPSKNPLWIIRWAIKEGDETHDSYSIHSGESEFPEKTLFDLNWFLNQKCQYDGRPLTLKDFRKDE
jgi:hypothetical protein